MILQVFLLLLIVSLLIAKIMEKNSYIEKIVLEKYVVNNPAIKSLIDLSNYYWNLEKKIGKIQNLSENDQRRLRSGLRGIKTYLDKNDIIIDDYTGREYHDGMNLDIVEKKDGGGKGKTIIKEVERPAIMYKNSIVQRSLVIIGKGDEK